MPTQKKEALKSIPLYKFTEWGKQGGTKSAPTNSARLKKLWKNSKGLKQAKRNVEKVDKPVDRV